MSKVIFLDIDGVLNSNLENDSHQREIRKTKKFSLAKADPTIGLTLEDIESAVKILLK